MPRITIATIARTSGLSKFAVSRALSGKSGVSEETRRRVMAIAEDLGYVRAQPQAPATTMIGLIFHDMDLVNSELQVLIQSGVQAEAQRLGYAVAVRWTHMADEIEEHVRQTAAAILVGPHERAALDRAYAIDKPLVRSGWLMPLEQVDQVSGTDHEAGSAVADYLLALGHRSILYVHGMPGYRGRMERLYGLREVVERREDVTFTEMRFDADTRFTGALKALKADGVNPTAFFCAHDGLAVTVISELLRLGYSIPQDASVIGFGDYSSAVQISPALTTVRVHGRQHGAACVRLIDDRLSNRVPPEIALRVQIAGHIIERDSCGPAPAPDAPSPGLR